MFKHIGIKNVIGSRFYSTLNNLNCGIACVFFLVKNFNNVDSNKRWLVTLTVVTSATLNLLSVFDVFGPQLAQIFLTLKSPAEDQITRSQSHSQSKTKLSWIKNLAQMPQIIEQNRQLSMASGLCTGLNGFSKALGFIICLSGILVGRFDDFFFLEFYKCCSTLLFLRTVNFIPEPDANSLPLIKSQTQPNRKYRSAIEISKPDVWREIYKWIDLTPSGVKKHQKILRLSDAHALYIFSRITIGCRNNLDFLPKNILHLSLKLDQTFTVDDFVDIYGSVCPTVKYLTVVDGNPTTSANFTKVQILVYLLAKYRFANLISINCHYALFSDIIYPTTIAEFVDELFRRDKAVRSSSDFYRNHYVPNYSRFCSEILKKLELYADYEGNYTVKIKSCELRDRTKADIIRSHYLHNMQYYNAIMKLSGLEIANINVQGCASSADLLLGENSESVSITSITGTILLGLCTSITKLDVKLNPENNGTVHIPATVTNLNLIIDSYNNPNLGIHLMGRELETFKFFSIGNTKIKFCSETTNNYHLEDMLKLRYVKLFSTMVNHPQSFKLPNGVETLELGYEFICYTFMAMLPKSITKLKMDILPIVGSWSLDYVRNLSNLKHLIYSSSIEKFDAVNLDYETILPPSVNTLEIHTYLTGYLGLKLYNKLKQTNVKVVSINMVKSSNTSVMFTTQNLFFVTLEDFKKKCGKVALFD
jgi:hypothetical protein